MKKKFIMATLIIAAATTFNQINVSATDNNSVEHKFNVKSDQLKDTIEYEENGKKYILRLNNVVSENEVKEAKEKNVEQTKEYIVETNNSSTILSQYPTLEYSEDGNSTTLNAAEIVSIEVAGEDEKYWETLETISKTLTLTAEQVNTMGADVTNITVDGKEYMLTKANFTPSEFANNEPTMYSTEAVYTTVVPNYEKTVNSYNVVVKYTGAMNVEEVKGYETVANYSVEDVTPVAPVEDNNIVPIVIGATAGTGTFLFVGWLFLSNIALYSGNKKVKSYRKGSNVIEIDVTKELGLYEDLNLVIKKRLAKRFDNTTLSVKANGKEIYRTVLNSQDSDMNIKI
ncbi:MAG: hypothetical protein ACRC68_09725 [Clostridium sp.]